MAFTAGELAHIANAALDFYLNDNGSTFKQTIQSKPLLALIEGKAKSFPGGKGKISVPIKLAYGDGSGNDGVKGFSHNDTVGFFTPANSSRAEYVWREHHIGFTMTHTELKIDGISVVDTNGAEVSNHSQREKTVLFGLLEDKLHEFGELYARTMNGLFWGDGTGDAKALAGMRSIITANPRTGTVGGVDRSLAANALWRNRARTAAHAAAGGEGAVTSNPANGGALLQLLQQDLRQLRRYGGNPNRCYAGSDFIGAMEIELRANGYYGSNGFRGKQDGAMGGLSFDGIDIVYDPTLDDLSLAKRAYIWDDRHINLYKMQGEWKRQHTPARPANQFVLYRSLTCTGQFVATQCNSAEVIDIA